MEYILLICLALAFFVTSVTMPYWIKRAKRAEITGRDIHKLDKRRVAELGGIIVIFGFLIGILSYVAIDVFYLVHKRSTIFALRDLSIMASMVSILIASLIGILDDILGWKIGLKQWQKPLLMLIAALPIVVINAGSSIMSLPLVGSITLGIIYPLIIIPIAISGASNAYNMLAGYNGLETGMGIIILSTMSYISWVMGKSTWVAVLGFCMVMALVAFYLYNKYPAKVFPGDTLTYAVGTTIAIMAIMGDLEKVALLLFIPYFIEFFLKLRGRFKKQSFARVLPDGSLINQYSKIYGIEHAAISFLRKIKKRVYEKEVVYFIFAMEVLLAIIAITITF